MRTEGSEGFWNDLNEPLLKMKYPSLSWYLPGTYQAHSRYLPSSNPTRSPGSHLARDSATREIPLARTRAEEEGDEEEALPEIQCRVRLPSLHRRRYAPAPPSASFCSSDLLLHSVYWNGGWHSESTQLLCILLFHLCNKRLGLAAAPFSVHGWWGILLLLPISSRFMIWVLIPLPGWWSTWGFCMYCWRSVVFWAAFRCVCFLWSREPQMFLFPFFSGRDGEKFLLLYRSSILGYCIRLGYDPVFFFVCLARSEFRFWCFGVGFWIWWSWLGFCEKVCWSERVQSMCASSGLLEDFLVNVWSK
jgi:hypothetical protein